MSGAVGWRDHLAGATLALAYTATLAASASSIGPARDEGFYCVVGDRYAAWVARAFSSPDAALSRAAVDRVWQENAEHPPLAKLLFGLSASAIERVGSPLVASTAHRLPAMVGAGLLLWMLYVFGARVANRRVGLFAAVTLAVTPHVFHHAHLASMDVLIVLACTATTYAYWRSLESARWAWIAGVLYGLALLTKHNAWFLPPVLLVHWATLRCAPADERLPASRHVPWAIVAMLAIGPVMLVGAWPWLWHDTAARFLGYVRFHVEHVHYPIEYLGTTYFEPPFPVHYALGSLLTTVPTTLVALALLGVLHRRAAFVPPWLRRLLTSRVERTEASATVRRRVTTKRLVHGPDARHTELLLLLSLLWPIALLSTTRAPIFGGTKHFLAAYPFLAFFAAVGFLRVARAVRAMWSAWRVSADRWPDLRRRVIELVVGLVLIGPAIAQTAHAHPYGLSTYVPLVGGPPGGADLGMNRQYWGQTSRDVLDVIRRELPHGGALYLGDTALAAWRLIVQDGHVPRNVRATADIADADLVLVHHEPHFVTVEAQTWVAHGDAAPIAVIDLDGVPIVSVYARPGGRARSAARR